MRRAVSLLAVVAAAPAEAQSAAPGIVATLGLLLPDPATAAIMFAGFGLIAAARRGRNRGRAD